MRVLDAKPAAWIRERLSWHFDRSRAVGSPGATSLSVYLGVGVVPRSSRDDNHNRLGEDLSKYLLVRPGDLVFNKLRTWQGGFGASRYTGIVSPAYFVLRPLPSVCSDFVAYQLRSTPYLAELTRLSKFMPPSQFDIAWLDLRQLPLAIPPLPTQRAIAAYLDRKTAAIDALIEKKQKLLDLLAEKRAALINQAVTKGLDPNVPMKDSGVPWIGEIPAHWHISQLRWIKRPGTSITYGIVQAGPHVDGGVPYIRVSDMSGDRLPDEGYRCTTPEIDRSYRRSRVAAGDLVVSIRAGIGTTHQVPPALEGANLTQGTAKVSVMESVSTAFVHWAMRAEASRAALDFASKGATFKEITLETLRKLAIPLPPHAEQVIIARHLNAAVARVRAATTPVGTQLDRLREYRQALITAAVTGQLDIGEDAA